MRLLKLAKIMIAASAAVFALSVNSYAGAWLRDSNGWWYCNDDRSYTTNNWQKINGAWYYFDSRGYMMHDCWVGGTYYLGADGKMLVNTRTPDGYFVGADGAWVRETDNYTPYMNNTLRYVSPNLVRDFGNYYSYNGKLVRELFSSNPVRDCGDYLEIKDVTMVLTELDFSGEEQYQNLPYLRIRKNAALLYHESENAGMLYRRTGKLYNNDRTSLTFATPGPMIFDDQWYLVFFSATPAG